MRSIMHSKGGECYLCAKLHGDYSTKPLQEHHAIFGTSKRKLSEKYGLKVYLCHMHHMNSPEAVHGNRIGNDSTRLIQQDAQRAFEAHYPDLDFQTIFGCNYIDHEDTEQKSEGFGFRRL